MMKKESNDPIKKVMYSFSIDHVPYFPPFALIWPKERGFSLERDEHERIEEGNEEVVLIQKGTWIKWDFFFYFITFSGGTLNSGHVTSG
jgi:hypothetical protein